MRRQGRKVAAGLVPVLRHQTAMEALGDIYRHLAGAIRDDWMADIALANKALNGRLAIRRRRPYGACAR